MLEVRKAGLDDLELLENVYAKDGRKSLKPLPRFPVTDLLIGRARGIVLLGLDSGKPVAFAIVRLKGEEASIDLFSVIKSYRNRIEQKFLKQAVELIPAESVFVILLKRSKGMIAAFQDAGFSVYDNVPNAFGKGVHGIKMVWHSEANVKEPHTKFIGGGVYKRPEKGFLELNLKRLDDLDR